MNDFLQKDGELCIRIPLIYRHLRPLDGGLQTQRNIMEKTELKATLEDLEARIEQIRDWL